MILLIYVIVLTTYNADCLIISTIMITPGVTGTVGNMMLISSTVHLIQPENTVSNTKPIIYIAWPGAK
jgi:hypothetical protein